MEFISGRDKSLSRFSMTDVQVEPLRLGLRVSLKPEPQLRGRYQSHRLEKRKYPAVLIVGFPELQEMVEALTTELRTCYEFLDQHNLMEELAEAKSNKLEADSANKVAELTAAS